MRSMCRGRLWIGVCIFMLPGFYIVMQRIELNCLTVRNLKEAKRHFENLLTSQTDNERSVLGNNKILKGWPKWTYKYALQPWAVRDSPKIPEQIGNNETMKRLPSVIGIGVKKCGTAVFQQFMSMNPRFKYTGGEPHFFDSDLYFEGLERYRKDMPLSNPGDVVSEKSPRYFIIPVAPARIREWNPNVQIILMLCDPVARTYSDYHHIRYSIEKRMKTKAFKKFNSFEEQINSSISDVIKIAEDPRKTLGYETFESFVRNAWNERTFQLTTLTNGLYYYHLKNWFNFFNRDQIHIVDGENFIKNPIPELKKVEKFLGLGDVIKEDMLYYDTDKGFYCRIKDGCHKKKGQTRQSGETELSTNLQRKLSLFFKPYNEKLFKLLGRKFDWL